MALETNAAVLDENAATTTGPDNQNLVAGLRLGLDRRELTLDYQPIVDLKSGVVRGLGPVLRLPGEPPAALLHRAGRNDVADRVTGWMLAQACVEARYWPGCRMSVPVASWRIGSAALLDPIDSALAIAGLASASLEIDLLEGIAPELVPQATAVRQDLRKRGVGLVLGNFGVGADDPVLLRAMMPSAVRLDAALVGDLPLNVAACRRVQALVEGSHAWGIRVLADGVESLAQREFLRRIGCDEAQGPLYSRPLPPDRLTALLDYGVDTCSWPRSTPQTPHDRAF